MPEEPQTGLQPTQGGSDSPQSEPVALLLAATDMEQVIQAARLLERESAAGGQGNEAHHQLLRAVETAIAVTYARGLKGKRKESWRVEEAEIAPTDPELLGLHAHLLRVRNKTYAHTDRKEALRTASAEWVETPEGELTVRFAESWVPWIQAHDVPAIVALATHQRDRFRAMALHLPPPTEASVTEREKPPRAWTRRAAAAHRMASVTLEEAGVRRGLCQLEAPALIVDSSRIRGDPDRWREPRKGELTSGRAVGVTRWVALAGSAWSMWPRPRHRAD